MLELIPAGASQPVIIIGIIATVLMTYLDKRSQRAEREQQKVEREAQQADLSVVKEQVSNTHSTNLREDMDAIHEEIRGFRREHREDISEVRDHLRASDTRQRSFETSVHAFVKRTHPEEAL
ncbi:DUF2746 domain-containing protein [Nocardia rhizosphaerihabitans]|uniref:DUF2746 domain-containing protein n=1 Tax=Nocardia rhizosphaerihabitans TaxID=1691570 RepID=UPI00366C8FA5